MRYGQHDRHILRQPREPAVQQFLLNAKANIALGGADQPSHRYRAFAQTHRHHQDFVAIVDMALIHPQDDALAARGQALDDLQGVRPDHRIGAGLRVLQLALDILIAVIGCAKRTRQRCRQRHQVGAAGLQNQWRLLES